VEFAQKIDNGDFEVQYKLLSEDDILGNALIEMQQNMKKAATERLIQAKEEEKRNWGTAGLAKFAEILRTDNSNMETLSYNIISNMVKYLDINQGGMFILNDAENDADKVLELKACYAYNRNKYTKKQIRPGEGLVGACFLEGEQIYLTKVPEKYIKITSGLGDANPRSILISPLKINSEIYGVVELASFSEFEPYRIEFVKKLCESIAATLSTVRVNIRTEKLLVQTKVQAEEMANQEEILRQTMEEMQASQEEVLQRENSLKKELEELRTRNAQS
jgi:hypothetical protein